MDDLFIEFSKYADDVETSEFLRGISLFKNIDKKNIKDLIFACDNKKKVSFTYKAPNTGKQQLEFITDGLEFRNRKFYLKGYNVTFQTNSFLLVSRIVSPITLFLKDDVVNKEPLKVVYLIKNLAKINFEESEQEKVVEFGTNEIKVEFTTEELKQYENCQVSVEKCEGKVCPRCWNIHPATDEHECCDRCIEVLKKDYPEVPVE